MATINRFTLVSVVSMLNDKPTVQAWSPAAYEEPALSSGHQILGVTMTDANYEQPVAVMKHGYLRDVARQNGETWATGELLYGKSDGSITHTRPAGPLPQIIVGTVFDTVGSLHTVDVDVRVLPSITELSGVTREAPVNLDVLIYNGTTHAWVPRQIDHGGDIAGLTDNDHPLYQRKHGFELASDGSALQTITYDKTARKITVTPTGSTLRFWIDGVQYVKTGAQLSGAHATTTGKYFYYYDASGVLQVSAVDVAWGIRDRTVTPVALVTWDNSITDGWAFYECHTADRTLEQHYRDHFSQGTKFISGAALTGYTLTTDTDAGITFAIGTTVIADEDIIRSLTAVADAGPYMVLWRTGASGLWTFVDNRTVPHVNAAASYVEYNNPNAGGAGVWGLTNAGSANYAVYYLCCTTSVQANRQFFLIPDQTTTGTLAAAQSRGVTQIAWGTLPFEEVVPLYKIIFRTGASYGSTGKCRIEEITSIIGTTSITLAGASPSIIHNDLAGRITAGAHPASAISFTPYSTLAATDVQAAIQELRDESSTGSPLLLPNGTAAVPPYSFSSATQTGMYWDGSSLNFSINNSRKAGVNSGGLFGAGLNLDGVYVLNFTNLGGGNFGGGINLGAGNVLRWAATQTNDGTAGDVVLSRAGAGQLSLSTPGSECKFAIKAGASQTANLQEWQNSSGTALSRIKSDGRFRNDGATTWEDLRFPAQGINPVGAASDPTVDTSDPFMGTLLFSPTVTNVIAGVAQMPHKWKEGTAIKPHIHWCPVSTNVGNVAWQLSYQVAGANETFAGSLSTDGIQLDAGDGTTNKHQIHGLGSISMTGKTVSAMVIWKLERVGGDASDTYTGDARLLELDFHYEVDSFGSDSEYTK